MTSLTIQSGSHFSERAIALEGLEATGGILSLPLYLRFDASDVGLQTVTATIDPNKALGESNSTNNSISVSVHVITCKSLVDNGLQTRTDSTGTTMIAIFTPNYGYSIPEAAGVCGFLNFNWQQTVTNLPTPSPFYQAGTNRNLFAPPSFLDPPPFGYVNQPGNAFPYYWDSTNGELLANEPNNALLAFQDTPANRCLFGGNGIPCGGRTAPPGSVMAFVTRLVGISPQGTPVLLGPGFDWTSNFNGTAGGVDAVKSVLPVDPGSGNGGVRITSVQQIATLPPAPPPTSSLASGKRCNGTFSGTFVGDVSVSSGQNCRLTDGRIVGNVTVKGGHLSLSGVAIEGDVSIKGASTFTIDSFSAIRGNLHISDVQSPGTESRVCRSTIYGNLKVLNNRGGILIGAGSNLSCTGNAIGKNLEVAKNKDSVTIFGNAVGKNLRVHDNEGPTQVYSNAVARNLRCRNNALVVGGANTARKKLGQCHGY